MPGSPANAISSAIAVIGAGFAMNARVSVTVAACLIGCASPAPLRAQQALTIDQAVTEAIDKNLSLIAERWNLAVADAAVVTAALRPNPVLSGSADHLDWLGTGFTDVNGAGPAEYALRVDVPFERGRKRELRMDVASSAKSVAEAQLSDTVRRLKLDVTLAAIDVLEAKAKVTLSRQNLESLERLVDLNTRRLTSGALAPLEVTRSRVAMLQYRGQVKGAELSLGQARLKLHTLVGRRAGDPLIDVDEPLGLPPAPLPADVNALQAAARASRPDVLALRLDQARTQADLRLQVAQGRVDYTVGSEYRRQQGVNGTGNSLGFFASVPLPIFNKNQGEIARAGAEHHKAERSLAALETTVAGEVASAYQEFESARQLLGEMERDLLKPVADARAGTAYVYQAGATSLLDVLDAQRAFNDTMDTYYTAQAAYRRAEARLGLVSGVDPRSVR
jgi:cobalt-zinc-cadmium efflux system outer membrane protein